MKPDRNASKSGPRVLNLALLVQLNEIINQSRLFQSGESLIMLLFENY